MGQRESAMANRDDEMTVDRHFLRTVAMDRHFLGTVAVDRHFLRTVAVDRHFLRTVAVDYYWQDLPQVSFLSRQSTSFVATKVCLL